MAGNYATLPGTVVLASPLALAELPTQSLVTQVLTSRLASAELPIQSLVPQSVPDKVVLPAQRLVTYAPPVALPGTVVLTSSGESVTVPGTVVLTSPGESQDLATQASVTLPGAVVLTSPLASADPPAQSLATQAPATVAGTAALTSSPASADLPTLSLVTPAPAALPGTVVLTSPLASADLPTQSLATPAPAALPGTVVLTSPLASADLPTKSLATPAPVALPGPVVLTSPLASADLPSQSLATQVASTLTAAPTQGESLLVIARPLSLALSTPLATTRGNKDGLGTANHREVGLSNPVVTQSSYPNGLAISGTTRWVVGNGLGSTATPASSSGTAVVHPAANAVSPTEVTPAAVPPDGQITWTGGSASSYTYRAKYEAGDQESDIMERMPIPMLKQAEHAEERDALTDAVMLVSLGCFCGPKLSFKAMGRGSETLPFDWLRTKLEGVLRLIAADFQGFFDTGPKYAFKEENGARWTTFRSALHSFWHDDPTDSRMRERYERRIKRFLAIDARSKPVLFVRSVATTVEIANTGLLLQLLVSKFGPQAKLLVVVDYQGSAAIGACEVVGLNNFMLYFNDTCSPTTNPAAPYVEATRVALAWAVGRPVRTQLVSSLQVAASMAKPTDWGLYGASDVPAFI